MDATQLREQQRRQRWGRIGGKPLAEVPTIINNYESQILYGSMLGDGGTSYNKKEPKGNARYSEEHSINQKQYLDWKVENCFHKWMKDPDKRYYRDSRDSGKVDAGPTISFVTSSCPLFTIIGHNWYKRDSDGNYIFDKNGKRIKKLPGNIALTKFLQIMSSQKNRGLGLAVWYMDDGSYHKNNKSIKLATLSFTEEENWFLVKELLKKYFGIDATVYPFDKSRKRFYIHIYSSGTRRFLSIVKPWVKQVPGMEYKLGIGKPPSEYFHSKEPEVHYIMQFKDGKMAAIIRRRNYAEALMNLEE